MELIICGDDLIESQLRFKRGLLINFNCRLLKDGIKRLSI